jgi:hypothetical protein
MGRQSRAAENGKAKSGNRKWEGKIGQPSGRGKKKARIKIQAVAKIQIS